MTVYVLEQLIRLRAVDFGGEFPRTVARLLMDAPDIRVEARPRGVALLAAHESALLDAVETLKSRYAGQLIALAPEVIYAEGPVPAEPIMGLVTELPLLHEWRVRHSLVRRGAEIISVDLGPATHVVHAQVPMTRLLGYPAELSEICPGAWCQVVFSHYAPVGPEGGSAA